MNQTTPGYEKIIALLNASRAGERAGQQLKIGDKFMGVAVIGDALGFKRGTPENRLFMDGMLDVMERRGVRVMNNKVSWIERD